MMLCDYMTPPLTTMVQPTDKIAAKALDILFDQIGNYKNAKEALNIRYMAELVERQSVRSIDLV